MGPNLYSQTPGAIHMGGGYASPFSMREPIMGNIYGTSRFGDTLGSMGASMPGHLYTLGSMAHLASGFGLGGKAMAGLGNTLGLGFLGGGLGTHLLVGTAMQYAASQFSRGQEQNRIAAELSKRVFGERNVGGPRGLGSSREAYANFSSAFRQLANSTEMLTNDQELKNVLTKFSDMKLLDTSKNLSEMATRVKKMSKTLREISIDLGTTLEGALPDVQRHVQMGFTDMDVMRQSIRTNRALRGVGINMSDSTVTALEMSQAATNFGMGGDKRLGALGAQRTLGNLSVAASMGLLTDKDLMAATGKLGESGVADLAQQAMQGNAALMQSSYGHLVAAALGEVRDGQFTGKLDRGARKRMSTMSLEELQDLADSKIQEGGAASFQRRMSSGMGANIASQLNVSDFITVLERVFEGRENEMREVVQGMTGMRGQTLDVLMKLKNDGERIIGETERRTRELAIRNTLAGVVNNNFTLSGRLNKAYRHFIAEPIGQPLQEMGSAVGTAFGNYGDNFSNQIIQHGIFKGISRGLVGAGSGSDLAEQSYADRTSDIRRAVELQFGKNAGMTSYQESAGSSARKGTGALTMAGGAVMLNPLAIAAGGLMYLTGDESSVERQSIFGTPEQKRQRILDASSALQEREMEGYMNSTAFGHSDEGFLAAYEGTRQDVDLTDRQAEVLMHALQKSVTEGDIEDMTEVFSQTAFKGALTPGVDVFDGTGVRGEIEERGGLYGLAKQLSTDERFTEGQRADAQAYVDKHDRALKSRVTLDDEDRIRAEQKSLNKELTEFFDYGTAGVDEYATTTEIEEFENTYLHETLKQGEFSKLLSYMEGLSDENKIRMLVTDKRFKKTMNAKDAVGLAKDVFGVEITEKEGAQAMTFFKALVDKYAKDGSIKAFAENMKGGTSKAASKLRDKIRTDGLMRSVSLMRELQDSSDLDAETRTSLITSFESAVMNEKKGTVEFFDQVVGMDAKEADKVKGEMGKALTRMRALAQGEGSVRDNLVANIQKEHGQAYSQQFLEQQSIEDLKMLASQLSIVETSPATRGSVAGEGIGNMDAQKANEIMLSLSQSVAKNMDSIASTSLRYNVENTRQIQILKQRTGAD